MKKIAILAILSAISWQANAGVGSAWAWSSAQAKSNGQVTLKSSSGQQAYSAVQNPTGALAKVNQSAVTQPPTVIIQATSGGGVSSGSNLAATRKKYDGNLGGLSGADQLCVNEFGAGWSLADNASIASSANIPIGIYAWFINLGAAASASGNCMAFTTNNPSYTGYFISLNSGVMNPVTINCSELMSLICVRR